jgi:hypothetical protein
MSLQYSLTAIQMLIADTSYNNYLLQINIFNKIIKLSCLILVFENKEMSTT